MTNGTMIVKRDGSKEHLNIDKIHFVVQEACEGLAGVSSSQIEMNANLQFTTTWVQLKSKRFWLDQQMILFH